MEEWGQSCQRCSLENAGPMEEVEGTGLGGQRRHVKLEEEEGEAGDGGEGEEAGLLVFLVWRAAEEEELRWGPRTVEGLHGCVWMGEEGEAELSCDRGGEEEGGHHEKEVEVTLQVGKRENMITHKCPLFMSIKFQPRPFS